MIEFNHTMSIDGVRSLDVNHLSWVGERSMCSTACPEADLSTMAR